MEQSSEEMGTPKFILFYLKEVLKLFNINIPSILKIHNTIYKIVRPNCKRIEITAPLKKQSSPYHVPTQSPSYFLPPGGKHCKEAQAQHRRKNYGLGVRKPSASHQPAATTLDLRALICQAASCSEEGETIIKMDKIINYWLISEKTVKHKLSTYDKTSTS